MPREYNDSLQEIIDLINRYSEDLLKYFKELRT